jgi:hypothetical protein
MPDIPHPGPVQNIAANKNLFYVIDGSLCRILAVWENEYGRVSA